MTYLDQRCIMNVVLFRHICGIFLHRDPYRGKTSHGTGLSEWYRCANGRIAGNDPAILIRGGKMGWEYHDRRRTPRGNWADQHKRHRISIRVTFVDLEIIRGRAYARQMSITDYIMHLVYADRQEQRTEPVSGASTPTVLYPQGIVDRCNGRAVKGPVRPCAALDSRT